MKTAADYFDRWLKSQEEFILAWTDSVKEMRQAGFPYPGARGMRPDLGQQFLKLYNAGVSSMAHSIPESKCFNLGALKEAMLKSANGSNIYVKLYEVWLPLIQAIEEKALDPASYAELLDPARVKDLVDRVFGFSPDGVSEYSDQASKLYDTWSMSSKEFVAPWADAIENNVRTLPQFMQGHPESLINIFHHVFDAYDRSFGRFLHVHAVGRDREKVELYLRAMDDHAVYMTKQAKYQYVMYMTATKAMEKVIERLADKIRAGEVRSFNEFFDLWLDVNEQEYMRFGKTEEYGLLQGELINSSLAVREHMFKLMELYLYDYPVALRSEMDDLYKTVYQLKKRVRELEKRLGEPSAKEAIA